MQISTLLTVLTTAAFAAAQNPDLTVCTGPYVDGDCFIVSPGQPPALGAWNSYSWPGGHTGYCAQFCNDCTSIGFACNVQDGPNTQFNKAFVYPFVEGVEGAPCC